jgi:hypothetical protein
MDGRAENELPTPALPPLTTLPPDDPVTRDDATESATVEAADGERPRPAAPAGVPVVVRPCSRADTMCGAGAPSLPSPWVASDENAHALDSLTGGRPPPCGFPPPPAAPSAMAAA